MTQEQAQQESEHRVRLSDAELTFFINCLKEIEKNTIETHKADPKNGAVLYNIKLAATRGMIRKLESVRECGKRQLRDFEYFALVGFNNSVASTEQE
jgi:hypothetical protein